MVQPLKPRKSCKVKMAALYAIMLMLKHLMQHKSLVWNSHIALLSAGIIIHSTGSNN